MDCPRCGTRLTRISLNGDLQSAYCEQCGFADVESDHTRASAAGETWDDALRRFRTTNAEASGESGGNSAAGAESDAADTNRDGGAGDDGDGIEDDGDGVGDDGDGVEDDGDGVGDDSGGVPDAAETPESESGRSDVDAEAEEA